VSEQKVEPEMVNPHPSIPAEFPGVHLESDFVNETGTVEPVPGPSNEESAAPH